MTQSEEMPEWQAQLVRPDSLRLIILPTEKCNFRCLYCYESFAIGKMKIEVENSIKRYIEKRIPSLKFLQISWFGGEPLLARDIVLRITLHAQSLCRENGIILRSDITTNGSMLDGSLFEQLVEAGVKTYQITLDGPALEHNRTRLSASGGETYSDIYNNLMSIRSTKLDFRILLRIHYHKRNIDSLFSFLSDLERDFSHDRRFDFVLRKIQAFGSKHDSEFSGLESDKESILLEFFRTSSLSRGSSSGFSSCYAASSTSYVVRSNGRIGKCTVALDSDFNDVGRITSEGTLELDFEKNLAWLQPVMSASLPATICPLSTVKAISKLG